MKFRISLLLVIFGLFASLCGAHASDTTRLVQIELQRLGFYSGKVDGAWGSQTAAAVRRFQLANDLRPTGELNPDTLTKLGIKTSTPPEVGRYKALTDLFKGGPMLNAAPETQVAIVRKAKENLKLLGFYKGTIDSDPTPELTGALERYQKDARFRVTGRLDKTTLQALDLLTPPNAPR